MNQLALFDVSRKTAIPIDKSAAPYAPGSATSQAAAAAIAGDAKIIRQRVLRFVKSRREHGATDFEIAETLGISSDTARPRRVELRDAGLIVDSGRTRPTRSGHPATVWIVSPKVGVYE